MSWKAESDHPLINKDAIIIVTMGAAEENYRSDGLYHTSIEDLMKPLTLSLEVNGIDVKDLIPVFRADDLQAESLKQIREKIVNSLQKS